MLSRPQKEVKTMPARDIAIDYNADLARMIAEQSDTAQRGLRPRAIGRQTLRRATRVISVADANACTRRPIYKCRTCNAESYAADDCGICDASHCMSFLKWESVMADHA
jgi:hypothetical protein